jgi:hypothetical protein
VNFFGHATVACWIDTDPRWVLGSMLPDFASMSRARLAGADDRRIAAGIALHHRTDDAFHSAPTFVSLCRHGCRELEAAGVGLGPARAVAHVGTELVLDGLLLDGAASGPYLAALAVPLETLGLRFRGDGAARFAAMWARLARVGLPEDYRSPARIAFRLEQILMHRPRLALGGEHRSAVTAFLERTRESLAGRAEELLDEVRANIDTSAEARDIRATGS